MKNRNEKEIIQQVLLKAWEDLDFRKNLIESPIDTIEKLTGSKVTLPEGKELIVLDQTDKSKVYINIPAEPDFNNLELSENQLEAIAGGDSNLLDIITDILIPDLKDILKV